MTPLNKTIARRAQEPLRNYKRRVVVTLEPGDVIGMRLERSRTTYRAPISSVFYQLAQWHAQAARAQRQKDRKLKKQ